MSCRSTTWKSVAPGCSIPAALFCTCPVYWGLGVLFYLIMERVVGGEEMIASSLWCLAAFPFFCFFLFSAFIHQWQFINSTCFTMISALSAKQLYDVVPLFDSFLALSHMHSSNKYSCPVYVCILYLVYVFTIALEICLPKNVVPKMYGLRNK